MHGCDGNICNECVPGQWQLLLSLKLVVTDPTGVPICFIIYLSTPHLFLWFHLVVGLLGRSLADQCSGIIMGFPFGNNLFL